MSAEPVRVRPGTALDAARVAELLNRIIQDRDGTALTTPVSAEEEGAFLSELLGEGSLFLAMQDERLLGFQSVHRKAQDIGEIGTFIAREARGRGVGRLLLGATLEWACQQNFSVLLAEIGAGNSAGIRAYRAWGFTERSSETGKVWLEFRLT